MRITHEMIASFRQRIIDGEDIAPGVVVECGLPLSMTDIKTLPDDLTVKGTLNIGGCSQLTSLPNGLTVEGMLDAAACTGLTRVEADLKAKTIRFSGCTGITNLPEGIQATNISLSSCVNLIRLPAGLEVDGLDLSGCTSLAFLPDDLKAGRIHLSRCTQLLAKARAAGVPLIEDEDYGIYCEGEAIAELVAACRSEPGLPLPSPA